MRISGGEEPWYIWPYGMYEPWYITYGVEVEGPGTYSMYMIECGAAIFAWIQYSFEPPSRALVAYHPEKGKTLLHDAVVVS